MKQAWIRSARADSLWVLMPGLIPVILVISFPSFFQSQSEEISVAGWVLLILCVDVAHVYSTVYRTYFNPLTYNRFSKLYRVIPFAGWVTGVLLYALNPLLFWRCLAYLAVFHFIRQQYGFMRIYSRKEYATSYIKTILAASVYVFTVIPVLIWHFTGQKKFNWFLEGDFIYYDFPFIVPLLKGLFFTILIVYVITEVRVSGINKRFNIPRFFLMLGTASSWYIGIVVFNGDLSFTFLNVLTHGIPYMALIYFTERKQRTPKGFSKLFFSYYGIFILFLLILAFAVIEEGLWDSLVWREKKNIFNAFYFLQPLNDKKILCFIVPLLALPQIVHYVLDGFIWKKDFYADPLEAEIS